MVNRTLTLEHLSADLLAEVLARTQGGIADMSAWLTIMVAFVALAASITIGTAQVNCQIAIVEFSDIVNTDTSMGHVAQAKQANAMVELSRIAQTCRAGRNGEALAALQPLQRRMGLP